MTKTRTNLVLRILPFIMIALVSGRGINNDDAFIDQLKAKLIKYNKDYYVERAYLMTDRYVYRPGEELWFKGFVASTSLPLPQGFSLRSIHNESTCPYCIALLPTPAPPPCETT